MEDKKQDVNSLEELFKVVNAYSGWFANLADELSKVLADIKISKKEEDAWKMKCPYKEGDEYWFIKDFGDVFIDSWDSCEIDMGRFNTGNTFPTKQAAELESKRRNLLTRFKAFRDECNESWYPNWKDSAESKYFIGFQDEELGIGVDYSCQHFLKFGYFKEYRNCKKAFELFGDKIKELFVECE